MSNKETKMFITVKNDKNGTITKELDSSCAVRELELSLVLKGCSVMTSIGYSYDCPFTESKTTVTIFKENKDA